MSMSDDGQRAGVTAEQLQEQLLDSDTLNDFLQEIATRAIGEDDDGLSCGITVRTSPRRPYTIGSSDGVAQRLDETQYQAGQGPCLHALQQGVAVDLPDLADQTAWPEFHRQALQIALVSSLSIPMVSSVGTVGALNLYTRATGGLTHEEARRARDLAERAGGAIALAVRLAEQQNLTEDLRSAMSSRSTIDQALGILMGQQRCTAEHAFSLLRQRSQHSNVKVRDVAADLITRVTGQEPEPSPFNA